MSQRGKQGNQERYSIKEDIEIINYANMFPNPYVGLNILSKKINNHNVVIRYFTELKDNEELIKLNYEIEKQNKTK